MSTHPNVILLARLKPDGLARKTMREILAEAGLKEEAGQDAPDVKIGDQGFHHLIMETDYDEGWQLSGAEGDLLFFNLVTYGYGESIPWEKLSAMKDELTAWAEGVCERHHCSLKIEVTANYW